jgi:hypothetical protein
MDSRNLILVILFQVVTLIAVAQTDRKAVQKKYDAAAGRADKKHDQVKKRK